MAKSKPRAKQTTNTDAEAAFLAAVVPKEAPPAREYNDMRLVYEAVKARLVGADIAVNASSCPTIQMGEDFVKDCDERFPVTIERVPPTPYVLHAWLRVIVQKGEYTDLRLDVLKNNLRTALKTPFKVGFYKATCYVIDEKDEKRVGVAVSDCELLLRIEKLGRNETI